MATTNVSSEVSRAAPVSTGLLVSLASLSHEALGRVLENLRAAFPGESVTVATPDAAPGGEEIGLGGRSLGSSGASGSPGAALKVVGYDPAVLPANSWTLTAADFLNAHELARTYGAEAVLMLGSEAQTLEPAALRGLAEAVGGGKADLAVPRYALAPLTGLVNSAILYPVTRALFGARPRFPLALDLCLSTRMAERLATVAQRYTATNLSDTLIWPVAEAAVAGYGIAEFEAGTRGLPLPAAPDLNELLARVAGSLFAEVDQNAAFWQRTRVAPARTGGATAPGKMPGTEEMQAMLDAFRLAYGNLHELWSLVLPPQSLLGLKRLATMPMASFAMPDSLWARIVYDFLLAYRLRTINRGHLLGALTPLYLAWVASHILLTGGGVEAERHVEKVAAAFEADKPYLVSRWRWPDRFNP